MVVRERTLLGGPVGRGRRPVLAQILKRTVSVPHQLKKSKPDPLPKAPPVPPDPKPGTSRDPDPVPPGPDPAPMGTITWPLDEEHWKIPQLPNEHSKRFYIMGSTRKYS